MVPAVNLYVDSSINHSTKKFAITKVGKATITLPQKCAI